ncbi:MAG TPA: lipid II flippase MurJ, partial [Acidimicrobiales bacterium]|nr:lipid II flippase MurJ [Acidimicrobiales bacterium]
MIRSRFARDSGVMAVGTTLSRLTGLLRLVALVYAVHFRTLADAYNLANTMPNVVHDVVLGGIVSATFVPVFVAELSRSSERAAWEAISAVTSVSVVVIAVASVAFLVASPFIVDAMTAFNHAKQAGAERSVATDLLVLFVPQLACYGCISVGTALLNARRRFAAPMFVPIVNNVVLVCALVAFGLWVRQPTLGGVYHHRGQLLLLGLGTTAGVVAQLLALIPSLRRAGLELRWQPRLGHPAVRTILRLSGWTVGLVVANQVALVVVLALSVHVGPGAVTAYTYAYTFFQVPYGVVAVSIMSAAAPDLAHFWTSGDMARFRRRMDVALRSMLAMIVPAAAVMVVLARPLLELLGVMIGHPSSTDTTAVALAMLSLGLPGFCAFLYVVRVLQSTQDLRSAFWLYV